jgi:hypothetical protein
VIVLLDPARDAASRLFRASILCRPDLLFLQGAMEALDVAVITSAIRVFVPASFQAAALGELLCKIRHELKINWWVDPLWDPLRDYTNITFDHADLKRLELNVQQLSQIIGQLRSQLENEAAPKSF